MPWEVELIGDAFDLNELALSMADTDPSIKKAQHGYILTSTSFEQCATYSEIEAAAKEILPILNGICAILLSTRNPISIAAIHNSSPGQPRQTFVTISEGLNIRDSMSITVTSPNGLVETTNQADPTVGWLKLAAGDQQVAKVFRLFNEQHLTWGGMYKIFEIIVESVGGLKPIADLGWASINTMKRFKHTANSPGATGDLARHGVEPTSPPAAPMAMSEAKAMINTLVHNWLRAKA